MQANTVHLYDYDIYLQIGLKYACYVGQYMSFGRPIRAGDTIVFPGGNRETTVIDVLGGGRRLRVTTIRSRIPASIPEDQSSDKR